MFVKMWSEFDTLQLYLCSCNYHSKYRHMNGRNLSVINVVTILHSYTQVHLLLFLKTIMHMKSLFLYTMRVNNQ